MCSIEETLTDSVNGVGRDREGVLEGTLVVVDAAKAIAGLSVNVDSSDVFLSLSLTPIRNVESLESHGLP